MFLIGDGGDDDIAGGRVGSQLLDREHDGGEAALHVVRAATIRPISIHPQPQRVRHLSQPDRIHMGVEHETAAPAGATQDSDHTWPARTASSSRTPNPAASSQPATNCAISSSPSRRARVMD